MSKRRQLIYAIAKLYKKRPFFNPNGILRFEGTIPVGHGGLGIFGRREKAEEEVWIRRHENEELVHNREKGDAADIRDLKLSSKLASSTAGIELEEILQAIRHIVPQHVKTELINWKLGKESIHFLNASDSVASSLGESESYDYDVKNVSITPTSGSRGFEYDTFPKVDKRTKEYRAIKRSVEHNATLTPIVSEQIQPVKAASIKTKAEHKAKAEEKAKARPQPM